MPPDAAQERPAPRRLRLAAAALVAAAVAAALHLPRLDRPLERSLASASTTYMVMFFRNWDEAGFLALRGLPAVGTGGQTLREREPYLHHPVLAYWAMYGVRRAWGWHEAAFRLVPMIATILAAGLTVLLAGAVLGPGLALGAGVLFAITPLSYAFGMMPNSDPLVVLWLLGGFLLHRHTRDRVRHRPALSAWFFVGALIEWQAYFLAPALLVDELLRPRDERRLRPVLVLFGLGVLAALLVLAHFALGLGSVGTLVEDLRRTVGETWAGGTEHTVGGYFANQLGTWRKFFGWPLLAVMAGLLVAAVARPRALRRSPGRLLAALAVPGLLAVSLFRTPAYDHAFFWMPILICVPTAAMVALRWSGRRSPVAGSCLAILVFGSCVVLDFDHERLTDDPFYRDLGTLVNGLAGPADLVITPETVAPAMFYTRAHLRAGPKASPWFMDRLLERRAEGRLPFDRLFLWMHEASLPAYPDLIAWGRAHGREIELPRVRLWIVD